MGWYIDSWYFILVVPALIFMLITQIVVKSAISKYGQVRTARGITGREMAEMILSANGILDVRIERLQSSDGDHYDPKSKAIRLSADVFDKNSVTAVGIAAHEAGHAVQHNIGYFPLRIRNFVIPITQFVSWLPVPLLIISVIVSNENASMILFKTAFIILFAGLFVQLITLPVEFDASRRAMSAIRSHNVLAEAEAVGARKVLTAAAMTYVAAFFVTLMNIIRLLMIFGRRSD
ncbi:MAG: zinc metallopeptidase [Clostridia bacterium]|nr:zinc metallopeptidase [Clostridia bacterium]